MATSSKKKPGFMADSVKKAKLKFGGNGSTTKQKAKTAPARKKKTKGPKPPRPVGVAKPTAEATQTEGTYTEYPVLAGLPDLVKKHQYNHNIVKAAMASVEPNELEKKRLAGEIEALMVAADLDGTDDEGVTVGVRGVKRIEVEGKEYVDPLLLLEAGVDIQTIKDCTKREAGYSYVLITNPKKKKGQGATAEDVAVAAEEGEGHGRKKYA
jgi:hypothetical protein